MNSKSWKVRLGYINWKALVGYLEPGVIALFFSLFIDIRFGVSFLVCLLILPVISIYVAHWTTRYMTASAEVSSTVLSKGDTVTVTVDVCSAKLWSLCRIDVELEDSVRFSSEKHEIISFFPGKKHSGRFKRTFKGEFWGGAQLGIRKVEVNDFLGLCRFPVLLDRRLTTRNVVILPDRPHLTENELLRASVESSVTEEDEDAQNLTMVSGGVPGYEHRAYVPGDSFRRINWKLSAKRDIYMVRLPEPISKSTQTLVLDPYMKASSNDLRRQAKNEELLVETLLGMCGLLTRQAMECSIFYYMDNVWHCEVVCDEQGLSRLQYTLARFVFHRDFAWGSRLPEPSDGRAGSLLLFTGSPDQGLMAAVGKLESEGFSSQIIVPKELMTGVCWTVDDDYTIERKDS